MLIKQFTLPLIFIYLTVGGCATLSKEECLKGDWTSVGREDGRQGYPMTRFHEHEQACLAHKVQPNLDAYQAGRNEGLREFCTPANGFELGKQAKPYEAACPADLETAFLEQYERGLDSALRLMEADIDTKDSNLSHKERQLSYLDSDKDEKTRNRLKDEIKAMETELTRLNQDRLKLIELRQKVRSMRPSF
jgi:hypothetical protein